MASEITVTLLRFAFLALLWVFIFMILAAARRDLGVGRNFRTTRAVPATDQVSAEPRQTQPTPPARPTSARSGARSRDPGRAP